MTAQNQDQKKRGPYQKQHRHVCPVCKREFYGTASAVFCSTRCRMREHRQGAKSSK